MVRRCPKCNGRHYDLNTYRIATCKICGHDWDIDDQDEAKQLVEGCQSDKSKMS